MLILTVASADFSEPVSSAQRPEFIHHFISCYVTDFSLIWLSAPSPFNRPAFPSSSCRSLFTCRLSVNLCPPPRPLCVWLPLLLLLLLLLSWLWMLSVEPCPLYSPQLKELDTFTHTHTQELGSQQARKHRHHDPAWGQTPCWILQQQTPFPQLNFKAE